MIMSMLKRVLPLGMAIFLLLTALFPVWAIAEGEATPAEVQMAATRAPFSPARVTQVTSATGMADVTAARVLWSTGIPASCAASLSEPKRDDAPAAMTTSAS